MSIFDMVRLAQEKNAADLSSALLPLNWEPIGGEIVARSPLKDTYHIWVEQDGTAEVCAPHGFLSENACPSLAVAQELAQRDYERKVRAMFKPDFWT